MSNEILNLRIHKVNPGVGLTNLVDTDFTVENPVPSDVTGNHLYAGRLSNNSRIMVAKFSVTPMASNREWEGYLIANSYQIATAIPVALVSKKQEPTDGLITELIDGPPLSKSHTESRLHLLGQELRKLHDIKLDGYGYITEGKPQFQTSREYLNFWYDKTLCYVEKNQSVFGLFKELHDSASDQIYNFVPSFIHRDVRLENVFSEGKGIKFIDFELWQGGDPMDEIAISLYDWLSTNRDIGSFRELIAGYYQGNRMTDEDKRGINFYLLLRAMRFVSFCERINLKYKEEAYQNLEQIYQFIRSERIQNF